MSTRAVAPTVAASVAVLTPLQRPVLQRTCNCGQHTGGGECEECKKTKMSLQRYADGSTEPSIAPPIVHDVLRSPGKALDEATRTYFVSRLGDDFSQVRVHTDEQAAESAQAVSALAHTVGNHVVFDARRYSPASASGRRLLAHELSHVVHQQNESTSSPQYRLEVGPSEDRFEREAGQMADHLASGTEESREVGSNLPPTHLPSTQVVPRVQRDVTRWARTGEITEVPEKLQGQLMGTNLLAAADRTLSGIGGAIGGAVPAIAGGVKEAASSIGGVFAKERDGGVRDGGDPQEIQAQLRSGHSLDGGVKSRMETAFGGDFSHVRVHTDSSAVQLSSRFNARAFTIGQNVAFGAGEYQPGTLIGDVLIAHELAHVIQQGSEDSAVAPPTKGGADYNALEEDADASAVGAVVSLWSGTRGKSERSGEDTSTRLRSGLRLQRCDGNPDKLVLKGMDPKQRELFAKQFIEKHFSAKDRNFASKILEDMLQSGEISFKDEEALKTEIFKRMETSRFLQKSQALYGSAFEYPNHPKAKACLPNNQDGKKINPRVNKAAEPYWGPVEDPQGNYHFSLSEAGKQNAYKALATLFTPQKSICNMTLIHCDYLASVVHFRAFAESIGIEEFNKRVKNGDIDVRLAWNGFQELEDKGWLHSKKNVSLREVRPTNENDLVIGDHVIFWNHRAYDLLNEGKHEAWRLENAILIDRVTKVDYFEGHGSGLRLTIDQMKKKLADAYNKVIDMARALINRTRSKDQKTSLTAMAEMDISFPNVKSLTGDWQLRGLGHGKMFQINVESKEAKINKDNPDLTGLHDPDDPSRMYCVKRPSEAPGESC